MRYKKVFSFAFYLLVIEYRGLMHGGCSVLHHLCDLLDHSFRDALTLGHETEDNLPLFEDDLAAQQQFFWKSVAFMEHIALKTKNSCFNIKNRFLYIFNMMLDFLRVQTNFSLTDTLRDIKRLKKQKGNLFILNNILSEMYFFLFSIFPLTLQCVLLRLKLFLICFFY